MVSYSFLVSCDEDSQTSHRGQQFYESLSVSRTPIRSIQRLKQQEVAKSPNQNAKKVTK